MATTMLPRALPSSSKSISPNTLAITTHPSITPPRRSLCCVPRAYTVTVNHAGEKHVLDVPEGETILSVCLDNDIDVPYDCMNGVCCRCSAVLVDGEMDTAAGMISPEAKDKKYVLLCTALPQSDVVVETIEEGSLLDSIKS